MTCAYVKTDAFVTPHGRLFAQGNNPLRHRQIAPESKAGSRRGAKCAPPQPYTWSGEITLVIARARTVPASCGSSVLMKNTSVVCVTGRWSTTVW